MSISYNRDRQPYRTRRPTGLEVTEGYLSNHGKNGKKYSVLTLDDALGLCYTQTPKGLLGKRTNATAGGGRLAPVTGYSTGCALRLRRACVEVLSKVVDGRG